MQGWPEVVEAEEKDEAEMVTPCGIAWLAGVNWVMFQARGADGAGIVRGLRKETQRERR